MYNLQYADITARGTVRRKRFSNKVRTGCKTCRRRRIKCDEGKPLCMKCSKSGLVCEGYQATFVYKSEASGALIVSRKPASHDIDRPIVLQSHETQDTIRSFQYYFEIFCPVIVRIFPNREGFWARTLPQAARTHQAVMHALTSAALSSEDASSATACDIYIKPRKQYHYSTALRMLTKDRTNVHVVLLGCIALFMFSCYERQEEHARLHINGGIRMIQAYQSQIESDVYQLQPEEREIVEQICIPFFDAIPSTLAFIFPEHAPSEREHDELPGFLDGRHAVEELIAITQQVANPASDNEDMVEQLRIWHAKFNNMSIHLSERKERLLRLFYKCIDRALDLFTTSADRVVRPTRLIFTLRVVEELAGSPVVDNHIRQSLSMLLNRVELFCSADEFVHVQKIRMEIEEWQSRPVVPFS